MTRVREVHGVMAYSGNVRSLDMGEVVRVSVHNNTTTLSVDLTPAEARVLADQLYYQAHQIESNGQPIEGVTK